MFAFIAILFSLSTMPQTEGDKEAIYSVYFDNTSEPGTKKVTTVNKRYFGDYELVPRSENDLRMTAGDRLSIDPSGIYIQKNKLLSISREEIRENSRYSIREGFLHGVVDNDSVMVALEGEQYYFLLPKKTFLYEADGRSTNLYEGLSSGDYLVLSQEKSGYLSALYLSFSAGKIALKELDFDQTELDFRTLTNRKIEDNTPPIYLLNPTNDEWQKLMQHFATYDNYTKILGEN